VTGPIFAKRKRKKIPQGGGLPARLSPKIFFSVKENTPPRGIRHKMVQQGQGDAAYVRIPHYTVHLMGGLGNQMFQLAFLEYIQRTTGGRAFLADLNSPDTPHSNARYFDTIFREWQAMHDASIPAPRIVRELHSMCEQTWDVDGGARYVGYFQRHEYVDLVRDAFVAKLHFDQGVSHRHPGIASKTFIHVRGGDYKQNGFHGVPLAAYYARCMELTPLKEFVIFTNDTPLATRMFPGTPIVNESEVDSLLIMSQCGACICANSSFSWWGAYLNPTRPIFMPARWFIGGAVQGSYYFEGVTVVDV
jgi:hypothetical protein